jgi:hypothetical protein
MRQSGRVLALVLAAALLGAVAYLRDPPWLISVESGLAGWETARDGTRYRWTGGHASFFVPSPAATLVIPVRATFPNASDWPQVVTISVDDRTRARVRLSDAEWHAVSVPLDAATTRDVRRIDVRVDRVRPGNRGVQLGQIQLR